MEQVLAGHWGSVTRSAVCLTASWSGQSWSRCWLVIGAVSQGQCLSVCLFVVCLTSQQQASVSQGRICSDNFTCCHTEIEVADPTVYLPQSQYTDIGPTSPNADPIMQGAWQGSHWSANVEVTGMTRPGKSRRKRDSDPGSSALEADALTTRPKRRSRHTQGQRSVWPTLSLLHT